jgi:uncharacterized protein YdhG (YjbR/CyaY superfamily)
VQRQSRASVKKPAAGGPAEVDDYIARVPEPARTTLKAVRAVLRSAVPAGTTESISYGIPTFKYEGPLIGYAAFARHCSLFPMDPSVIEQFASDLKDFPTSKGTIRFPVDKAPPAALLRKLVRARVESNKRRRTLKNKSE